MTPPGDIQAPIVHRFVEFYKLFYAVGPKIPKRDRFGIYATTDQLCLDTLQDIITAALQSRAVKLPTLTQARTRVEVIKRLIRLMHELRIAPEKWYIAAERELQEISKMLNGWLRYVGTR